MIKLEDIKKGNIIYHGYLFSEPFTHKIIVSKPVKKFRVTSVEDNLILITEVLKGVKKEVRAIYLFLDEDSGATVWREEIDIVSNSLSEIKNIWNKRVEEELQGLISYKEKMKTCLKDMENTYNNLKI